MTEPSDPPPPDPDALRSPNGGGAGAPVPDSDGGGASHEDGEAPLSTSRLDSSPPAPAPEPNPAPAPAPAPAPVDPLVDRAARFLANPSVSCLPEAERTAYLRERGLGEREIREARDLAAARAGGDRLWEEEEKEKEATAEGSGGGGGAARRRTHRATHPSAPLPPPPPASRQLMDPRGMHMPPPVLPEEVPGVAVPLALGGAAGVFALAALRWLNGGEFHLFPPPCPARLPAAPAAARTPRSGTTFRAGGEAAAEEEARGAGSEVPEEDGGEDDGGADADESQYYDVVNEDDSEDGTYDGGGADPEPNPLMHFARADGASPSAASAAGDDGSLSARMADLASSMERLALAQERALQERAAERAREKTDETMDLLRYRQNPNLSSSSGGDRGAETPGAAADSVAIAVLLTEIRYELAGVREALRGGEGGERVGKKLDAVAATFGRVEGHLMSGEREKEDEAEEFPLAGDEEGGGALADPNDTTFDTADLNDTTYDPNDTTMYETPARGMFEVDNLSPVSTGKDTEVTALDVTLTLSPDASGSGLLSGGDDDLSQPVETDSIGIDALATALQSLSEKDDPSAVKACAQMLYMYVSNLSSHPAVKRYRRVFTTNATFKNKVGCIEGAVDVLTSVGFIQNGSVLEWKGDLDGGEAGLALLRDAAAALNVLKVTGTTALASTPAPPSDFEGGFETPKTRREFSPDLSILSDQLMSPPTIKKPAGKDVLFKVNDADTLRIPKVSHPFPPHQPSSGSKEVSFGKNDIFGGDNGSAFARNDKDIGGTGSPPKLKLRQTQESPSFPTSSNDMEIEENPEEKQGEEVDHMVAGDDPSDLNTTTSPLNMSSISGLDAKGTA